MRGLAVLIVFLFHYAGGAQSQNLLVRTVGSLVELGWSGVTLFFVLSGYLISGILWSSRGRTGWWRRFLVRRCLRLFPLYYFALALLLLSLWWNGTFQTGWNRLLIFALYLQNCFSDVPVDRITGLRFFHFWSLSVEEQFYLLWPFVLIRMPTLRRARQMCLFTIVGSMLLRAWVFSAHLDALYLSMPVHAGELATGAWVAFTLREHPEWISRLRRWAGFVLAGGVGVALVCGYAAGDLKLGHFAMYVFGMTALSAAAAALLVLASGENPVARMLRIATLRHLGTISYGVYVYHILFKVYFERIALRVAPHASHNVGAIIVLVVAAIFTLGVAEISWWCFERPILGLKERLAPA